MWQIREYASTAYQHARFEVWHAGMFFYSYCYTCYSYDEAYKYIERATLDYLHNKVKRVYVK